MKSKQRKTTGRKAPPHSSSIVFLLSDLIPGACALSNLASDSGDLQNPGALVGRAQAAFIFFRASSTCRVYEAQNWSLSSADCMLRSMNDCVCVGGVGWGGGAATRGGGRESVGEKRGRRRTRGRSFFFLPRWGCE